MYPKKKIHVEGTILEEGKHSDNYKVLLIPPGQSNFSQLPLLIEDLTSATYVYRNNACDKSHRNTSFLLQLKKDCNVSKTRAIVSIS